MWNVKKNSNIQKNLLAQLFKRVLLLYILILAQACTSFTADEEENGSAALSFNSLYSQIFEEKCLSCHNSSRKEGGVDLSSYDALMSSNVVVPYSSSSSTLFISVNSGNMPPTFTLSSDLKNLIAEWIDAGALETTDISKCSKPSVLLPRLTHFEYKNIIFDTLKEEIDLSELNTLPTLPPRYGFDNISNTNIDRVTAEAYINVAETVNDKILSSSVILNLCSASLIKDQHTWDNCGVKIIDYVGRRLYRRPLRFEEVNSYRSLFFATKIGALNAYGPSQDSDYSTFSKDFAEAVSAVLITELVSPNFLYKMEFFPEGFKSTEKAYSLASKLSLSLTSSYPDSELWALAANGKIQTESVLKTQISRLLNTYNSRFAHNFAGQWLGYKDNMSLGNDDLDGALARESDLLVQEILDDNSKLSQLMSPGYTFVNDLLANHYNLGSSPSDDVYTKISSSSRGGLLSLGHFLKKTSGVDKTKPVKRGIWVLDKILCRTLPPIDKATLEEIADVQTVIDPSASVIERMEIHRDNSKRCYSCHSQIDPIGLALENWDHLGQFRTNYSNGDPVIANLKFNGVLVSSPSQLAVSVQQSREYRNCVQKKLESYFIGSSPVQEPQCATQVTEDVPFKQLTSDTIFKFLKESL
ncbi:MAG: DUF1588 domain-containing protein [Bdellovibrionaceae bacterium]|nr:DUF1588 domain-containing protein [Pseudobdellovibrionaceae bacterium]